MRRTQEDVERRRRTIRAILAAIILMTIPFYCLGVLLWGTAPQRGQAAPTSTPGTSETSTPLVVTATFPPVTPSITPLPITDLPPAEPPTAVIPPTIFLPTLVITNTPPVFPTLPPAPTLLPTQAPPTQPPITNTPLPFDS